MVPRAAAEGISCAHLSTVGRATPLHVACTLDQKRRRVVGLLVAASVFAPAGAALTEDEIAEFVDLWTARWDDLGGMSDYLESNAIYADPYNGYAEADQRTLADAFVESYREHNATFNGGEARGDAEDRVTPRRVTAALRRVRRGAAWPRRPSAHARRAHATRPTSGRSAATLGGRPPRGRRSLHFPLSNR